MKSFALLCTFAIALKLKEFDGEGSDPFDGLSLNDLQDMKTEQFDTNFDGELDDNEWINLATDFETKMDGDFDDADFQHYSDKWNEMNDGQYDDDSMNIWMTDTFSAKHGDENGALDREGVKKFAKAMFDHDATEEEIEEYFNFLDENKDDKIELGEQDKFWEHLQKNGEDWEDCYDCQDPIWSIRDAAHRILDMTDQLQWQNESMTNPDMWMDYDGDWMDYDGSWMDYDGSWMDYDGSWMDYDGSWMDYDGSWMDYDGSWMDYDGSWMDYDGSWMDYDGSWMDYDGSWMDYDGSWMDYDGEQMGYDGDWMDYDGSFMDYDGDWMDYDGDNMWNDYDGSDMWNDYDGSDMWYDGEKMWD